MDEQKAASGSSIGRDMGPGLTPKKQPQIADELQNQDKLLSFLGEEIARLNDKLLPVSHPIESDNEKDAKEGRSLVVIAGMIAASNERIQRLIREVSGMRERLEV